MIGAFLNALGILLGALLGLAGRGQLSARNQNYFKSALAAFIAFCGLQLLWQNLSGSFSAGGKQLLIVGLALVLGNLLGKILRLQKLSNRLGRHASALLATGQQATGRPAAGFVAATILFCAAPLGILGAVTDGLADYFPPLALKAVMDGLAMASFVKMFRWPAALAALPVFFWLSSLTYASHTVAGPWLAAHHWTNAVQTTAGLVLFSMTLVVLEVRRVELANYLPALAVAPLLTWFFE